ncbi:MAG: hypothetical protein ACOYK8_00195 [Alphaproteobacteria bacterium]
MRLVISYLLLGGVLLVNSACSPFSAYWYTYSAKPSLYGGDYSWYIAQEYNGVARYYLEHGNIIDKQNINSADFFAQRAALANAGKTVTIIQPAFDNQQLKASPQQQQYILSRYNSVEAAIIKYRENTKALQHIAQMQAGFDCWLQEKVKKQPNLDIAAICQANMEENLAILATIDQYRE